jgi:hypothetical protein
LCLRYPRLEVMYMNLYREHNANPKNRRTADCVIRAFAVAAGKSWDEVLDDLSRIAVEVKSVPCYKDVYTLYAKRLGFVQRKVTVTDGHKPTVASFTRSHPSGSYILRLAHHIVAVKDGAYWDTWDCGDKSVYTYWELLGR